MRLVLREHGEPVESALPDSVAARVARSGLVGCVPLGDDRWRLTPGALIGTARIGDVDIVVEPKIGPANLLFLLGYALDPGFRPDDVEGVEHDELLPVVAEFLARQTERAIRAGVLQGYVTHDDSLMVVRGRIRVADQLARRAGIPLPVEVRYDEYSPDITENRIVRSAIRRMITMPRVSSHVRQRLAHLDSRLDGVTPLVPGDVLPTWMPSRLNQRYRPALRIAEVVLRHLSVEVASGGISMASFVVDMAKVFEDFVTIALQEAALDHPGLVRSQYPVSLAMSGAVLMYPDVVHVVDGRPHAVFDAKYKIEARRRDVPNADVYQMLAYCTALELSRGHLVYAKGEGAPLTHRIVNTDPIIEIEQHPLDLTTTPTEVLQQVHDLVTTALGLQAARRGNEHHDRDSIAVM